MAERAACELGRKPDDCDDPPAARKTDTDGVGRSGARNLVQDLRHGVIELRAPLLTGESQSQLGDGGSGGKASDFLSKLAPRPGNLERRQIVQLTVRFHVKLRRTFRKKIERGAIASTRFPRAPRQSRLNAGFARQ